MPPTVAAAGQVSLADRQTTEKHMKPRKIKSIVSAVLLAAGIVEASAQSTEPFNPYSEFKASAEAWAMSRYGNAKPTFYTGAMNYSVPVYTYEDPEFSIPVSLEYQFDGYRPSQHSGTVGYGWHLNCGGAITREVRGLPDDDVVFGPANRMMAGYYKTVQNGRGYVSDTLGNNVWWSIYCNTICTDKPSAEMVHEMNPFAQIPVFVLTHDIGGVPKAIDNMSYDLNPDIYHFTIPGHSGDFMLMPDGSVRVFNCDLPHGEVKVEFTGNMYCRYGNAPQDNGFRIITGDGTRYYFGGNTAAIDYSASTSMKGLSIMPSYFATAFRLVKIEAPNGRCAEFCFSSGKQVSVSGARAYTVDYQGGTYTHKSENDYKKTFSYFSPLESVIVDGKQILLFEYEQKLYDECAPEYFYDSLPSAYPAVIPFSSNVEAKCLSGIKVINADAEIVEEAFLTHEYASKGTPKMFLSKVKTRKGGQHGFKYDLQTTFPQNDRPETDHWGFWNGYFAGDIRNSVEFSGSRYSQMLGSAKEANSFYAKKGGLIEITYPTGGRTIISYEGNKAESGLDEEGNIYVPTGNVGMDVGGVRVSKMEHKASGSSLPERCTFTYSGGFLYHMPRYLFRMPLYYSNASSGPESVSMSTTITGYNADCDYSVSRDENIGYKNVDMTMNDGSVERYRFSTWDDYPDLFYSEGEGSFPYTYMAKRGVFSFIDHIGEQMASGTAPNFAIAWYDNRNMRGRILSRTIISSEGTAVQNDSYSFACETIHLNQLWWNDVEQFVCTPWTCASPILKSETVTDYADDGTAVTNMTVYEHNQYGQVSECTHTESTDPGRKQTIYFSYFHESDSPSSYNALPGALHKVAITSVDCGQQYLVGAKILNYDNPSNHIHPSSVEQHTFDNPLPVVSKAHALVAITLGRIRKTEYHYNEHLRPSAVILPGNKTINYHWSGNHVIQKAIWPAEKTIYEWKDMVGLTSITDAAGHHTTFEYDPNSRLSVVKDSAGNSIERYDYGLANHK